MSALISLDHCLFDPPEGSTCHEVKLMMLSSHMGCRNDSQPQNLTLTNLGFIALSVKGLVRYKILSSQSMNTANYHLSDIQRTLKNYICSYEGIMNLSISLTCLKKKERMRGQSSMKI